jgi:bacteriocin-like protein
MSTNKIDPSKKDATISSADDLVKSGDVELSEEELKRVTGGSKARTYDKLNPYEPPLVP